MRGKAEISSASATDWLTVMSSSLSVAENSSDVSSLPSMKVKYDIFFRFCLQFRCLSAISVNSGVNQNNDRILNGYIKKMV